MTKEEGSDKKKALLKVLESVERGGKDIQVSASNRLKEVTFALDVADCVRQFAQAARSDSALTPGDWEHLQSTWEGWLVSAAPVQEALKRSEFFGVSSVATTLSTATILTAYSSDQWDLARFNSNIGPVITKLGNILARYPQREVVRNELIRLGINKHSGTGRTAAKILDEACDALDHARPDGEAPIAVLISLRESIEASIVDLLPKRRSQEPAKSWMEKVMSVGRQCGKSEFGAAHFERLGRDIEQVIDSLSPAKRRAYTREELIRLFDQGLLFLSSFLGSLDETRLRV